MTFGLQCDEPSVAILDRAAEGGVDFLDSSDAYPIGKRPSREPARQRPAEWMDDQPVPVRQRGRTASARSYPSSAFVLVGDRPGRVSPVTGLADDAVRASTLTALLTVS